MKKTSDYYWAIVFCGILCAAFEPHAAQYASSISTDGASGYVGCRFNEALCPSDEVCIYDGLFGNCQKRNSLLPDLYQYELSESQRHDLELVLLQLIDSGYTWSHEYTQCVITNILQAYRLGISYDVGFCIVKPQWDVVVPENGEWLPKFEFSGSPDENYMYRPPTEFLPLEYVGDEVKRFGDLKRESGEFEEFLSGLSRSELESLKKYVIEDSVEKDNSPTYADFRNTQDYANEDEFDESVIAKKDYRTVDSEPVMMTRVVVNYDPGDNNADAAAAVGDTEQDKAAEYYEQSPGTDGTNGRDEQMQSSTFAPVKQIVNKPSLANDAAASHLPSGSSFGAGYGPSGSGIVAERIDQAKLGGGRVGQKYLVTMYILCGLVGGITLAAITIYLVRRRSRLQEKLAQWATVGQQPASEEYQDLCRQHMQAKFSEKSEPVHPPSRVEAVAAIEEKAVRTGSTGSSTSSWSEEPVSSSLDISTGHIVLSYMEDHLKNKDRLQKEWDTLCAYDAEPCSVVAAIEPTNMRKNRYSDILPYEHSRVRLNPASNVSSSDYINASTIMDHDPRNPAYIATQGPLPHTVADFWQMVWEQGSIVVVNLTRLTENSVTVCHRYWPEEGSDLYHIYEVHLVSEHVWCEDYIIRSFYLKNLQTNETRTVTQFHFIAWPNNEVPSSAKTMLDFRRKVNKSFRCRSSPVIVHCSDGAGRTGTYCLIDMVLNRLSKGAKEIDIAATLEHIRDQRINMVRTKEQFEFALTAVAQEVQAILHAPAQ